MMINSKILSWGFIALLLGAGCSKPVPNADENSAGAPPDSANTSQAPGPGADATGPDNQARVAINSSANATAEPNDSETAKVPPYQNPLSADQQADGWLSLFDGYSLFGWTPNDDGVNWHVEDGAIVADSGPIGLLLTSVPFADFELICEYELQADGNSGLFLRTIPQPQVVTADCYELNIADAQPQGFLTGSLVGRAKTQQPILGSGGWQTLRVMVQGNQFRVFHDGAEVLDYTDDSGAARTQGFLGLQKNAGRVAFRKVLLRPLGLKPLLTNELEGWQAVPGSQTQFERDGESVHLTGGPGFLESVDTFGDFVLRFQARTNAENLNSGIFFRAMTGTEEAPSNGYELQIQNEIVDGDPTRPADSGTGAIFRRAAARRVVSEDQKWFTGTLVASGNQFAVWVDGYQVVNWQDERDPNENPRRGQRLEAGHLSLQGHDATTDVEFRNLQIAELSSASTSRPDASENSDEE